MTRGTTARIAGVTFLVYIGVGVTELVLRGGGAGADGTAVRLARIGQHASAVILAVTLYLITWLTWLPMLVFEVTLALWLIVKGVAMPAPAVRPTLTTTGG